MESNPSRPAYDCKNLQLVNPQCKKEIAHLRTCCHRSRKSSYIYQNGSAWDTEKVATKLADPITGGNCCDY